MHVLRTAGGMWMWAVVLCVGVAPGLAAPLAMITEDVPTSFGTYRPIEVELTAGCRPFTIAPDFSNVSNFDRFEFTEAQQDLLRANGFVAMPSRFPEIYDIYKDCGKSAIPVFVTVDSMLHIFHEQFDYILKWIEKDQLLGDASELTAGLLEASLADYESTSDTLAREAARANLAYFTVARRLLDTSHTLHANVAAIAEAELALIDAHAAIAASPLLVASHDYSQFVPRGHYAGDDDLERYFRLMMWYGTMRFSLDDIDNFGVIIAPDEIERMALQGLLVTRRLYTLDLTTDTALVAWNRIYQPTTFFVGKSEDITIETFDRIARDVYGADWLSLSPDALADPVLFAAFMQRVEQLPRPRIADDFSKSFRLMGQREIPDSRILEVTSASGRLPYGLDVMAVLGSTRAEQILDEFYHDPPPGLGDLKTEFAELPAADWAQNLYWNWLYCLMPVLDLKGPGYPPFMQTAAWQDKDLAAALGSWAELRHDTLLYAKQGSYAGISAAQMDQGYVEPNPEAFARLRALCRYAREGLDSLGLIRENAPLPDDWWKEEDPDYIPEGGFAEQIVELEQTLTRLQTIAEKELTWTPISYDEYVFLREIGPTMSGLTDFHYFSGDQCFWEDDMAVVADVHTHVDLALEEAVGRPLSLFVIVDIAGSLRVTHGAAFSYYEFTVPLSQRLTDEAWRQMLDEGSAPAMPGWMDSYCDPSVTHEHILHGQNEWPSHVMNVVLGPDLIRANEMLELGIRDIWMWYEYIYDPGPPWTEYELPGFDAARAVVTRPDGEMTTVTMEAVPDLPEDYPEFTGSIDTTGWGEGIVYVEGQLTREGDPVLSYRTFTRLLPARNAVGARWRGYP